MLCVIVLCTFNTKDKPMLTKVNQDQTLVKHKLNSY
jgi:hypothetical protein